MLVFACCSVYRVSVVFFGFVARVLGDRPKLPEGVTQPVLIWRVGAFLGPLLSFSGSFKKKRKTESRSFRFRTVGRGGGKERQS